MFGWPMLDVIIGLMFLYLLLALVCTVAMEVVAGILDSRTRNLRYGIKNLFGEHGKFRWWGRRKKVLLVSLVAGGNSDESVVDAFFDHPLVKSLREDRTNVSYLPSQVFTSVLLDLIRPANGNGSKSLAEYTDGIKARLPEGSDLRRTLLLFVDEAGGDLDALRKRLEGWFNDSMDRVSAWYKNKTQGLIFIFAILISVSVNADTLRIANELSTSVEIRSAVVSQVEATLPDITPSTGDSQSDATASTLEQLKQQLDRLDNSGLNLGWESIDAFCRITLMQLVGILLSAMAASLGAPFWFDKLKKVMSIRAVGKTPEEKVAQVGSGSNV